MVRRRSVRVVRQACDVSSAIGSCDAVAAPLWPSRGARHRLPSAAIRIARVGRGRWPGRERSAAVPEDLFSARTSLTQRTRGREDSMAVHAGVFFFDGRPTTVHTRRILEALDPFAPDGLGTHSGSGIAMVQGSSVLWTGEQPNAEPSRSPSGLTITWDGRLDNRSDLQLSLGDPLTNDSDDAATALAVFERWGVDG